MALPEFSPRKLDGTVPFRILGGSLSALEFEMAPGDEVLVEPGRVIALLGGATLDVDFGKGILDPFRRMLSGEQATLQKIRCEKTPGRVVVGAAMPGRIVRISLDGSHGIFCDRGAYLCHSGNISVSIGFSRRIRAGLFSGQGFVMQRISGYGDVFLHALGSVIAWRLQPGMVARVNTRNLLAFDDTVGHDIEFAGGVFPALFGGQGLFFAKLEGPGRVIMHSIDHKAFVDALRHPGKDAKQLKGKAHADTKIS